MGDTGSVEKPFQDELLTKSREARKSFRRTLVNIADKARDNAVSIGDVINLFSKRASYEKASSEWLSNEDHSAYMSNETANLMVNILGEDPRWRIALEGLHSKRTKLAQTVLDEEIKSLRHAIGQDVLKAALEEDPEREKRILQTISENGRDLGAYKAVLDVVKTV